MPQERSEDGTPIYRHKEREREFEVAIGDEDSIKAIEAHIETHVGKVKNVFHEIVSDLVHIDVHVVEPTKDRPYYTLITTGMSDKPMTLPEGADKDMAHAELCVMLPKDWKMSEAAFKDEKNYWPIRALKFLARLPHEYETWLGHGHTIPNGDPAEPYADGVGFTGFIILPPINLSQEFWALQVSKKKTVNFYVIAPLYTEEMDFKLKQGLDKLIDKLDASGDFEMVINTKRKNACKKKGWFGFGK